ncbi:stress protein [Streptomyces sp. NWU339]|uniref:universal stress protein n=1 Tax=Streptomyces sp. NWU339 TaxID=2185284 RepID=UPI000D673EFA|nr:universal stress protein [Streptomyces sp. NWU339]PWI10180.1 stress protein [Streptomyces sp. NWU339]
MVSPVVVGVDGSAESLAAAEWAAHEAVRRGRALRLLHARNWHPRQDRTEVVPAGERHLARRVLRHAAARVRAACPGVPLYDQQVAGPATAALARAADDAGLLVLGSRGLGRLSSLVVGSVALGVVARATRPVVLVRADTAGEEADAESTGRRDVVLGVDVTEPCGEVLAFAFEAARLRHARLRVLHAWRAPDRLTLGPGEVGLTGAPQRAEEWLGFLSAVLQVWREKYPEVEVLQTVVEGKPAGALLKAASGAELLVVGDRLTDRRGMPRTGPVTHAVIHRVGCPVAIVPHD